MRSRHVNSIVMYGLALILFANAAGEAFAATDFYVISEKALTAAERMIGKPYKYSGSTPQGFDCSGLVQYSYLAAGLNVPRATGELRKATQYVESGDMRRGDLVFFDRNGKKYGHVGLYAGNDRFVHAPSRGKSVRVDSLQDPYWKERFNEARRFKEGTLQIDSERNDEL